MTVKSKSEHILELAEELLENIELSKCSCETILLKATRLARYVGTDEEKEWLNMELNGYRSSNRELKEKYMSLTGRWTDKKEGKGYWMSLSQVEAIIDSNNLKLSQMSLPNLSGDYMKITMSDVMYNINHTTREIQHMSGIRSKVLFLLHRFISNIYYSKVFDSLSESIFDNYKKDIDILIAESCKGVIEQIPSVIERLSNNDREAISHALTSCRRIIDGFADYIYPARDETIEIGGNTISLKQDKVQNRINAYVNDVCASTSRRKKIRQSLSNLYDRVSTGVHADVDLQEAKSLFLETYLILGEILSLKKSDVENL